MIVLVGAYLLVAMGVFVWFSWGHGRRPATDGLTHWGATVVFALAWLPVLAALLWLSRHFEQMDKGG